MSDQRAASTVGSKPDHRIEHVIVLMLENRSFDHLFAFADLPPCAKPTHPHPDATGLPPLTATAKRVVPVDGPHSHGSVKRQLALDDNGAPTMTGFADAYVERASGRAPALAGPLSRRVFALAIFTGAAALAQIASPIALWTWLVLLVVLLVVFVALSFGWLDVRNTILSWALGKWGKWLSILLAIPALAGLAWWRTFDDAVGVRVLVASVLSLVAAGLASAGRSVRSQGGPNLVEAHGREVFQTAALSAHHPDTVEPLVTLAKEFGVCPRWHCSVPGETWPNRNFAVAGTSDGAVDIEYRLFTDKTIFESLDEHHSGPTPTWRVYFGDIPQVLAFKKLWQRRGSRSFKERFQPNSALLTLLKQENPALPAFSFVEPHHHNVPVPGGGEGGSSQHPNNNRVDPEVYKLTTLNDAFDRHFGGDFDRGLQLVVDIYNGLRNNSDLFEKTLFVITYDEHGGCYDRIAPSMVCPPTSRGALQRARLRVLRGLMGLTNSFEFTLLGPRVPAIVVSPWIAKGTCQCDDQFDHSAIPRTVRDLFGITEPLSGAGAQDREALSPSLRSMLSTVARPVEELPMLADVIAPIAGPVPSADAAEGRAVDPMAAGLLQLGVTAARTVARQTRAEGAEPEPELVEMGPEDGAHPPVAVPTPELDPSAARAVRRGVERALARRQTRRALTSAADGDVQAFDAAFADAAALLRDPATSP